MTELLQKISCGSFYSLGSKNGVLVSFAAVAGEVVAVELREIGLLDRQERSMADVQRVDAWCFSGEN